MGRYSLRDGKIKAPEMDAKHLALNDVDNEGTYAAPYIKMTPVAKGGDDVYIFVGTANRICAGTTVPVGTSGAYSNTGAPLGTAT